VSRQLKESTKKLCRLFKDNSNLEKDAENVRIERHNIRESLAGFMKGILENDIDPYIQETCKTLENQNLLSKYLNIEKKLNQDIKKINQDYKTENSVYNSELQEKNAMI
jgi:IQ domain-containing protein G